MAIKSEKKNMSRFIPNLAKIFGKLEKHGVEPTGLEIDEAIPASLNFSLLDQQLERPRELLRKARQGSGP